MTNVKTNYKELQDLLWTAYKEYGFHFRPNNLWGSRPEEIREEIRDLEQYDSFLLYNRNYPESFDKEGKLIKKVYLSVKGDIQKVIELTEKHGFAISKNPIDDENIGLVLLPQ
ncbi:hypothetical protein [Bacillus paranthracis]|uniref:hypothetical protein n=1 Tax=Bacillus paranthracis TaxID=2026186 RepID=UPI002FDC7581|nr:DUF2913 family protein [Bacillus paranthracis]